RSPGHRLGAGRRHLRPDGRHGNRGDASGRRLAVSKWPLGGSGRWRLWQRRRRRGLRRWWLRGMWRVRGMTDITVFHDYPPPVPLEHRKSTAKEGWRVLAGTVFTVAAFVAFGAFIFPDVRPEGWAILLASVIAGT